LEESSNTLQHQPLVSFGLPVRDGAATIAQAIESIQAQTLEDWELIVSDNLSTDGTSEICASYAANDRRVRHVATGRDLTQNANFIEAFRLARGTFFRWYGDDDWLEPTYAERVVAALGQFPEAVLCTTMQRYYRDGVPLPINDPVRRLGGVQGTDASSRLRALLRLFEHGGFLGIDPLYSLVRREVAMKTGLTGDHRYSDFSFACELALLGPFTHVPEVLAHRRLAGFPRTAATQVASLDAGWRGYIQREISIIVVARAARTLNVRSRLRVGAALVGFAAREHAHGLRRRLRALARKL
jgi:glycosyltransferase involved in cell wall biosynthesis